MARGSIPSFGFSVWELFGGTVFGFAMQVLLLAALGSGTLGAPPIAPALPPVEFLLLPATSVEPSAPQPLRSTPVSPDSKPTPPKKGAVKRTTAPPKIRPWPRQAPVISLPPAARTIPEPAETPAQPTKKTAADGKTAPASRLVEDLLSREKPGFSCTFSPSSARTPQPSAMVHGAPVAETDRPGNRETEQRRENGKPKGTVTGTADAVAGYLRNVHDLLQKRIGRDRGFRLPPGRAVENGQVRFRIALDGRLNLDAIAKGSSEENERRLRKILSELRLPPPPKPWNPDRPLTVPLVIRGR